MNHVLPNFVPTRYAMWHRGYFCATFIPRHCLNSLHQGSSDHPRSKKKSRMKRCKNNWIQIARNTTIHYQKFIFFVMYYQTPCVAFIFPLISCPACHLAQNCISRIDIFLACMREFKELVQEVVVASLIINTFRQGESHMKW